MEANLIHKELEKYLSQIEKQLAALPSEQREEELREIRSHLEMMIDENVARGDDADQAVAKALEQFGAASKVGKAVECTHESSFQQKNKMKRKMLIICALIYSTNLILYLFNSTGLITHSYILTSGYLNFTVIIAMFVCGWMNESMNHKKLDTFFIKAFPAIVLFLLLEIMVLHLKKSDLLFPLGVFVSMAAGARAYRWHTGDRKLFNWR